MSKPRVTTDEREVRVCVFDNPATCARECWQDGKLIRAYSAGLFFLKKWPVPPERFFFGANIGPWVDGQLVGDYTAMEKP